MGLLQDLAFLVAALVSGVLVIGFALRIAGAVARVVPTSPATRDRAERGLLIVGATVLALYILVTVAWFFRDLDDRGHQLLGIALMGGVAMFWRVLRDVAEGLYLRASGALHEGDTLRFDGVQGRIRELKNRALLLELPSGELALIPYSRLAGQPLYRQPTSEGLALHVFRVELPPDLPLPVAKRQVQQAVTLSSWAAPRARTEIRSVDEGRELEIALHLVDQDQRTEAEQTVRDALRTAVSD